MQPQTPTLAHALRQARDELALEQPPAGLLPKLQHHLAASAPSAPPQAPHQAHPPAQQRPSPRQPALRWAPWLWSGGLAFTAVLVGSVVLMLTAPAPDLPFPDARELRMTGFVPLVAAERWPADAAPAWLVSTELRQDRLALLGLPYDPAHAGDSVRAELLVRACGEVLAVRLAP
jgi:hypothetical protein